MQGTVTFPAEVTHVSRHGFWILIDDEELFLPFEAFPWFGKSSIERLCEVERPTAEHLYWPALDIDVSVRSIRDLAAFPLVSAAHIA